jgi:riboflavin kinase/FMN adenylyltransferase
MLTVSALEPVPPHMRGACAALGNFDGLHIGHRAVVASAQRAANASGAPLAVATFEPAPRRYFQPDAPPFRLMTPRRRELTLEALGVDLCALLHFDADMAAMTPREFVQRVIVDALALRSVSIGADFRFGHNRAGDATVLKTLGAELGFAVDVVELVVDGPEKVSSSRIREKIEAGDMAAAAEALAGYWTVDAVVEAGEKRGRTLGFPTANMKLGEIVHPAHGVYAVWARAEAETAWRPAVASFGRTPTTGLRDALLEVHVFDFAGDLYGQRLHTAFAKFLRPEAKFASLEELTAQMNRDAAQARTVLSALPAPAQ